MGHCNSRPRKIVYKFLAAFNRGNVNTDPEEIIAQFAEGRIPVDDLYSEYDEVVQKIEKMVKISGSDKESKDLNAYWKGSRGVVGLDWVGDEFGLPFCMFKANKFVGVNGIVAQMQLHNPRFGIRIHCGESAPVDKFGKRHMKILHEELKSIYAKLSKISKTEFVPLRIGHGIEFCSQVYKVEFGFIKSKKIPVELNFTSNHYLVGNLAGHSVLQKFLKNQIPVIICTDDDGIWPMRKCTRHYDHISVASEICRAIEIDDEITEKDVHNLIKNSSDYIFFADPPAKPISNKEKTPKRKRKLSYK